MEELLLSTHNTHHSYRVQIHDTHTTLCRKTMADNVLYRQNDSVCVKAKNTQLLPIESDRVHISNLPSEPQNINALKIIFQQITMYSPFSLSPTQDQMIGAIQQDICYRNNNWNYHFFSQLLFVFHFYSCHWAQNLFQPSGFHY